MTRLELTRKLRKDFGWVLIYYVLIAGPLSVATLIITWGDGVATFISCLVAVYGVYHLIDGINWYRHLKHEEERLLRASALFGERKETGE